MKKSILTTLILISFSNLVKSQITLDGTIQNSSWTEFGITNMAISGYKYYLIDESANELKLYNLDLSVYKTITIPISLTNDSLSDYELGYVSENLFDLDNGIEYVFYSDLKLNTSIAFVKIFDEDGSTLFYSDSVDIYGFFNFDEITPFIYNTSEGVKMKIRKKFSQENKFYSLPGSLLSVKPISENSPIAKVLNAYPNPSKETVTIEFELPNGSNKGTIMIYDQLGNSIKSYDVDDKFKKIMISSSELSAGTYYYSLQTDLGSSQGKKMIVIK